MAWYDPRDWNLGSKVTPSHVQNLEGEDYLDEIIKSGLSQVQGRQAPQAAGPGRISAQTVQGARIDPTQQAQFRAGEMAQANRLQAIASGQQKGAGEMAVDRQIASALAAQQANTRSIRGAAAPQAGLAGARAQQEIGVTGAGMAGEQALRDRSAAEGMLTGVLGQGRSADIGMATSQAGLEQQAGIANQGAALQAAQANQQAEQNTALANLQARLAQQGMNDQQQLALMSQMTGMDIAELQARLQANELRIKAAGTVISGIGQGIGAAFSDRRLKKDIHEAGDDVDEMLSELRPYRYRYRDERHGAGERVGIMAQDLERSARGRELILELPEGKAVDTQRAVSAALAAAARLHERIAALESR